MADMFKLIVRFTRRGAPLTGSQFTVRFFDQDVVKDDLLGEAALDGQGRAEALCAAASAKGWDSPGETKPDIYCDLFDNAKRIYRSPVRMNCDFGARDPTTQQQSLTIDLGSFDV